jgi:hypothetical protein
MTCKLCQTDQPMKKRAHILPAAFYKDYERNADTPLKTYMPDASARPKLVRGGIYDDDLVCIQCEDRFQSWDDYGAKFFLERVPSEWLSRVLPENRAAAFPRVDYAKLKLFAISLLWRASATSKEWFAGVKLGPYEETARQMILAGDPGGTDTFACVSERFIAANPAMQSHARLLRQFSRKRIEGINGVDLSLGECTVFVKADRRPLTAARRLQWGTSDSILVAAHPFDSSHVLKQARASLAANAERGWRSKALDPKPPKG